MTHTNNITVDYATALTSGYGHKTITVSLVVGGNQKNFSATTNAMYLYDAATDLDGQDKYDALYDIIRYQIADQVNEWIDSI